jgi:hypothetical protein
MPPHDAAPEGLAGTVEGRAPESLTKPVRQRKIIHIDMDAFYASEPENLLMKARQDTARFCCGV